jgi:hypothetical protein
LGCGFATHDFVEVAALAAGGGFLIQQSETALVELVEPIIPADFFERALAAIAGEIEAKDAWIVATLGAGDRTWLGSALFCPAANLVMISRNFGTAACHLSAPFARKGALPRRMPGAKREFAGVKSQLSVVNLLRVARDSVLRHEVGAGVS